jgi:hypothetical protein
MIMFADLVKLIITAAALAGLVILGLHIHAF